MMKKLIEINFIFLVFKGILIILFHTWWNTKLLLIWYNNYIKIIVKIQKYPSTIVLFYFYSNNILVVSMCN